MNKKAFTLLELLVVVAIISVLAGSGVIVYNSARTQARDNKRLSDIMTIQNALELYKKQEGVYPASLNFGQALVGTGLISSTTYLAQIPTAPLPPDGNCTAENNNFYYYPTADLSSYTLAWCSGKAVGNLISGQKCTNPNNTSNCTIDTCNNPDLACGVQCTYEGKMYNTVAIGDQCWFKENLNVGTRVSACDTGDCNKTDTYSGCKTSCYIQGGGTDRSSHYPRGTNTNMQADANSGTIEKFCFNDDENNCGIYGAMYQWHTIMKLPAVCDTNDYGCTDVDNPKTCKITAYPECTYLRDSDYQGICPTGWHIPSRNEFWDLAAYLGDDAGANMKVSGTQYWNSPNSGDNSSGFSALGGGLNSDGAYVQLKQYSYFWTRSPNLSSVYPLDLNNAGSGAHMAYYPRHRTTMGLRCVKDLPPTPPPVECSALATCGTDCVDNGITYRTVQVGAECWTKDNINIGTRIDSCTSGPCSGNNCAQTCTAKGSTFNKAADADTGTIEKYCYNDDEANCTTYGGQYLFHTIMGLPAICTGIQNVGHYTAPASAWWAGESNQWNYGITSQPGCTYFEGQERQGICPTGFHLPDEAEFNTLISTAGGTLKSTEANMWITPNVADNSSGFELKGAGTMLLGSYYQLKQWTQLFSETPNNSNMKYLMARNTAANSYVGNAGYGSRQNTFSVRCLKNDPPSAWPTVPDCYAPGWSCGQNCNRNGRTYSTVQSSRCNEALILRNN